MDNFSARLIEAMNIRNLTQSELAKRSGISRSKINCYVHGRYEAKQPTLHILAKALDVSETWLMGYDVATGQDTPAFPVAIFQATDDSISYPVIGQRLRTVRNNIGLTLDELAKKYNEQFGGKLSKGTLSKYENGKQMPMSTVIHNLAQLLHISTDYLMGTANTIYGTMRMIPIYENASSGFGHSVSDCVADYIPMIIHSDSEAATTICIRAKGDSMYPKIENGDLIQVHKQSGIDNGKIGVFLIDGTDCVIRKVCHTAGEDWLELQSLNPEYAPKHFEGAAIQRVKILGLVKRIIKEL